MITVVLNGFKRQKYLNQQIDAVLNQTIPPERILIWNNGDPIETKDLDSRVMVANNSCNLGVWSRFAYALNAETEFVCVLDDDTFPMPGFFESCLSGMKEEPALFGARGLRFMHPERYHPFKVYGWDAPNEETEIVDIVGHAWFFKREWLGVFWHDMPPVGTSRLVGEDMHLSFMLQKHLNIKTKVPPHPNSDLSVWGSDPVIALKLGTGDEAINQSSDVLTKFDSALKRCTSNGFRLYRDTKGADSMGVVIGPGVTRFKVLKQLISKVPVVDRIARRVLKTLADRGIHI